MSAIDTEPFPRGALIAAGALVVFSLAATTFVRLERLGSPTVASVRPAPARAVDVKFTDEADGSVGVHDGRDGHLIETLAPGTNGFVRSVMRGLAHERMRRGIGPSQPFRVTQARDGKLALEDPATGRLIDLDAFGAPNAAGFADMLPKRRVAS
jgi:putative photosynthetic complex assembly protein